MPAPTPSQVTLAAGGCFGTAPSFTATPQSNLPAPTSPGWVVVPAGPLAASPAASPCCDPAPLPADRQQLLCPSQAHSPALLPAPGLALLPGFAQPCQGPRELPGELGALPCLGPCKQPPDTCTQTRPVLRTLLRCWPTRTGLASRAAAVPRPPVPGCRVCAMGAGSCSGAAGLSSATSPRAIAMWQQGAARGHSQGRHRSARVPPAVCSRESLAVTSGDKAPYREGRCLATACGRLGEGAGGGSSCAHPGGFACSAAPTYQGLHSAAARVGCPRGRQQRDPCGPRAGGSEQQLRPHARNTMSRRGTRGLESLYPV